MGDELAEEEIAEFVSNRTTPGLPVAVPHFQTGNREAIERGHTLFVQQECRSCHGNDGRGAPDLMLRDNAGNLIRPRDLVREPFKGGHEPAAVFRRIRLGLPGTPMPAHTNLTDAQVIDLVNFVTSLSREPKQQLKTHERRRFATTNDYLKGLSEIEQ